MNITSSDRPSSLDKAKDIRTKLWTRIYPDKVYREHLKDCVLDSFKNNHNVPDVSFSFVDNNTISLESSGPMNTAVITVCMGIAMTDFLNRVYDFSIISDEERREIVTCVSMLFNITYNGPSSSTGTYKTTIGL